MISFPVCDACVGTASPQYIRSWHPSLGVPFITPPVSNSLGDHPTTAHPRRHVDLQTHRHTHAHTSQSSCTDMNFVPTVHHPSPATGAENMYQHGYIGLTFGPQTESFFSAVLKTSPRALQVGFSAPGWPGAFFITHINNPTVSANAMSSRGYLMIVLDYRADLSRGTIVPQVPWFPQTPRDMRKYVTDAVLQLPIFLRQDDGTIGMSLSDVIHGNFRRLMDSVQQVNVGGRTSVHVRINVSALLGSNVLF